MPVEFQTQQDQHSQQQHNRQQKYPHFIAERPTPSNNVPTPTSQDEQTRFLTKSSFGINTSLTLQPIVLEGVEFPAGTVVRCTKKY